MKKKIFLAAPFFNLGEREFNTKIAKALRSSGFNVWMAQETSLIKTTTHCEKRKLFDIDISALKSSDVVVAVLDGVEVDSGTSFELGYAAALGKPIVGLKTDYRTFSPLENLNLMLEVSLIKLCKNIEEVIECLKQV